VNVLLTALTSSSGVSGVQRHALNLAAALLDRKEIDSVHLAVAPWQQDLVRSYGVQSDRLHVHVVEIARNVLSRNLWFYSGLPRLARNIHADVVHVSYPVPVHRSAFKVPLVVTLHDLYPFEVPDNFGRVKASMHRRIVRQCLSCADAITCVSQATAESVAKHLPERTGAKTSVVYNCVVRTKAEALAPPLLAGREPFLLSIAQHRHNKNIPLLVRIFARLLSAGQIDFSACLVIIGMSGPETAHIETLVASLGLPGRVLLLKDISEGELRWSYEHCEALVVPSITEGFCLPVAEALLAGSRLICSDIPVLREIANHKGIFVPLDSDSERRFADAISTALHQPKPAPTELPHLSARTIGGHYVELYHDLVTDRPALDHATLIDSHSARNSGRAQI
jgi:glycosyltransferase involved in cell wall biosynthesis